MISVIIPVFNEENSISITIKQISNTLLRFPKSEIIIVNDGSQDNTYKAIKKLKITNLLVINHVENQGYGKSLYDGILLAKNNCIAIIDGDGSYPVEDITKLYQFYPQYDMIVGARSGEEYKKGIIKRPARLFFHLLVEYTLGRKIPDVNSGLRIFKKDLVMKFQDSLCMGFSFTTTLTLIFFLQYYNVKYIPICYLKRTGRSKVRHFWDTLRALQLIVQSILYYNPIKLFLLLSVFNFSLGVLLEMTNIFFFHSRFLSIFAAISASTSVPVFTLGLLAEQLRKIYQTSNK